MFGITGLEVIRGNASFAVSPGGKVELTYGDSLRITTSFSYRGPAINITLYGAIGKKRWAGFDEVLASENPDINLLNSPTAFSPVTASVDIPITADIDPGTDYDIYCKIKDHSEAGYPEVDDVITITGLKPTLKLLEETLYPYAYVYDGPCEQFIFTFTTIPFTPASWVAGRLAAHCEDEIRKRGGRVMEMRVYVDENLWRPWTNWQIEIIGIPPATIGASIGIVWWVAFIIVVLGLIALMWATYTFIIKPLTYKRKPIDEEIKATWSRESLISVIGDFEAKLEKTLTPPEELEAKSDQELRDYCDLLAEEIVPPKGLGWGTIAVVGALGLGAVTLLALSKRKK